METLKLKEIAAYMPYMLKLLFPNGDIEYMSYPHLTPGNNKYFAIGKPLLRPMSDLIKPLPDGTIPIVEIAKMYGEEVSEEFHIERASECLFRMSWTDDDGFYHRFNARVNGVSLRFFDGTYDYPLEVSVLDYLHEHMFDYRNLIGRNLAVDLNSVKI